MAFVNVVVAVFTIVAVEALAVVLAEAVCAVAVDTGVGVTLVDVGFAVFALCSGGTSALVSNVQFLTDASILTGF